MAGNVDSNTSLNSEDSDVPVSMVDVLADEKQLQEDANAVLGDSDDKNCTYFMGYVPRQALYSCVTCIDPNTDVFAGVCLACSLECHEGHDLVELYTKRYFRCDCGNSKFGGDFKCKLSNKIEANEENTYNQNFHGKYCTCSRPYPDPEDDVEDDMIQCVVCEDWYHGRHLNSKVPVDYEEMICGSCMTKCDFLWPYINFSIATESEEVDVTGSPKKAKGDAASSSSPKKGSPKKELSPRPGISKGNDSEPCKKKELEKQKIMKHKGATFWPEQWRQKLCKCYECMSLYEKMKVNYLLDENDSIKAYEERGRAKDSADNYEGGLKALSGMDRHMQVEMLHGYNDMKTELSDYLRKFAENGKVVREEDIKEFFEGFQAKKKQKKTPAPQYYCK